MGEMKRVPSEVKSAVRRKAEAQYPDDFYRQLDLVEAQFTAFRAIWQLIEQHHAIPDLREIVKQAVDEWTDDYSKQLRCLKAQLEASAKPTAAKELPTGDRCFDKASPDGEAEPWGDEDMQMLVYRGYWEA